MKTSRKRIALVACAVLCVAVIVGAAIALHRPVRHFVIEVKGPADRQYEAVFVVDGERRTETITLPMTFRFYAREVAYGVAPLQLPTDSEASDNVQISGHMYLEGKSIDFQSRAQEVGGYIKSPKRLGVGNGDFVSFTGPGVKATRYLAASNK